jgi:hypothetical protein
LPFVIADDDTVTLSKDDPQKTEIVYAEVSAEMQEAYRRTNAPVHFFESLVPVEGDKLPAEIMWFRAGTNTYYPEFQGKPIEITVQCEQTALGRILACADWRKKQGAAEEPWADFNHEEKARSFEPTFWAWRDGKDAGLFVGTRWSASGATSIKAPPGQAPDFNKFSPHPLLDAEYDKLEEDDDGCLRFPDGARGSKTNPCRIIGFSKVIGGLTNKPAIKDILPIAAEEAARGRTAAPNKTKQGAKMDKKSVYFIKKPTKGGYAEGATVEMESAVADGYITSGEAIPAESAPAFQAQQEEVTRLRGIEQRAQEMETARNRESVEFEIQNALTRGAIAPKEKVPGDDGKEVLFVDYLRKQGEKQPEFTIKQLKMMKGQAHLEQRTVNRDRRDDATASNGPEDPKFETIKFGDCTFEEGVRAWQFAQKKARDAWNKRENPLVLAALRREAFDRYERLVHPAFANGGNPIIKPEWGTEFASEMGPRFANSFATLASTNIVSNRTLILLRQILKPFSGQYFDFSSEGVKLNQAFITRTIGVSVVQHKTATGLYADSDVATYDVSVTPTQISYVQNTIDVVVTAATTRNVFGEQKEQKFYGLAKDCFTTWTGVMTDANFDKTASLGRAGYSIGGTPSRLSLIGIDNDLDSLLNPEEGRIVLFNTNTYNALRTDPALVSYWQAGPESEARRTGQLGERENLMPYKTQALNSRNDILGFAQTPGATACAGRLPDLAETAAGVQFAGIRNVLVEPETGLSFLETLFCQPDGSSASHRVELIFAAGAGQANQGEIIVA